MPSWDAEPVKGSSGGRTRVDGARTGQTVGVEAIWAERRENWLSERRQPGSSRALWWAGSASGRLGCDAGPPTPWRVSVRPATIASRRVRSSKSRRSGLEMPSRRWCRSAVVERRRAFSAIARRYRGPGAPTRSRPSRRRRPPRARRRRRRRRGARKREETVSLRKRARACGTKMIVLYFTGFSPLLAPRRHSARVRLPPSLFESLDRSRRPGSGCRRSYGAALGSVNLLDRSGNRRRTERSKGQGFGQVRRRGPVRFRRDRRSCARRGAPGGVARAERCSRSTATSRTRAPARVEPAVLEELRRREIAVAEPGCAGRGATRPGRAPSRRGRGSREDGSPFAGPRRSVHARSRNDDVQVDPVEQGAGELARVAGAFARVAAAGAARIAGEAAGARVHRRDEQEVAGEDAGPADAHDARSRVSSSGWRIASRASRRNSGSSSRKSAPRCASEISPGTGRAPPPTRPGAEIPWCGARKGGVWISPAPAGSVPATEWIRVTSIASASERGARMPGSRRASIVLPAPGGPGQEQVMAARRRDLRGPARDELAAHVREVRRRARGRGVTDRAAHGSEIALAEKVLRPRRRGAAPG